MSGQSIALLLIITAGVVLGILLSRRLITMRDVVNVLIGVVLGILLAQYVLPRRILGQVDHNPHDACISAQHASNLEKAGQVDQATDKCWLSVARMTPRGILPGADCSPLPSAEFDDKSLCSSSFSLDIP